MHVTYEQAEMAIASAIAESKKLGTQMCIAVVDSGADLKAFVRMNGAWGEPLYGIEHSNDGLITFPGGVPIVDQDGVLIGAIGVSGSSVENDHQVAKAGVVVIGLSDLPSHPWRT
jgi:uncharacterized protein GlcG (DUF336 family)